VNSSTLRDGFIAALKDREVERRLQDGTDLYKLYDIHVAYVLDEEDDVQNMLERSKLNAVVEFENELTDLPKFQATCSEVKEEFRQFCIPGVSLPNYALPTLEIDLGDIVPKKMTFDGSGRDVVPQETFFQAHRGVQSSRNSNAERFQRRSSVYDYASEFLSFQAILLHFLGLCEREEERFEVDG
jgi:hypothetical protein